MNRFFYPAKCVVAVLLVLALSIFSIGCDGSDGDPGPQGPPGPAGDTGEITLLITINAPLEWAGVSRMGMLLEPFMVAEEAAKSADIDKVVFYFAPEASHYVGESADYPVEPNLDEMPSLAWPDHATLGDLARHLSSEYDVYFMCSAVAAGHHQITLLDPFIAISAAELTEILVDANRTLAY